MSEYSRTDQHICNEMVTNIAKLARLRLTEQEVMRYQDDFRGLLEVFHALDGLAFDTDYQPEKFFIQADDCREDVAKTPDINKLEKASAYYNASTSYFDVPQFIGNDDE
jgi:aspartyl/glutamyl-tRNA(Asn/Gln) amidotransferase C subunit